MRLKREEKASFQRGFYASLQMSGFFFFFFLKAIGVTEELGMSGLCSAKKHPSYTEGKCEQAVIVEAMGVMVPKGIPEGWDVDGRKFHWRDEGMLRWSSGFFSSSPNGKEAGTLKLKDDKSGNFSPAWNIL